MDGNELTLQVGYLAPVALIDAAVGRARRANAHCQRRLSNPHDRRLDLDDLDLRRGYAPVAAYARAKLAVVAHACWLADNLRQTGSEVVSMRPGVISTPLLHAMFSIGGDRPEPAAAAIVEVAAGLATAARSTTRRDGPNRTPSVREAGSQRRLHELTMERLTRRGSGLDPAP